MTLRDVFDLFRQWLDRRQAQRDQQRSTRLQRLWADRWGISIEPPATPSELRSAYQALWWTLGPDRGQIGGEALARCMVDRIEQTRAWAQVKGRK